MIKTLPSPKVPGLDGFNARFHQTFQKELMPILLKLFHKIETEGALSNSFCKVTFTLVIKPHKVSTEKKNYRWIFLMNINTKILNKILAK